MRRILRKDGDKRLRRPRCVTQLTRDFQGKRITRGRIDWSLKARPTPLTPESYQDSV